jgi:transcriptional regulator with XRE-family HTH domain
VDNKEVGDRIRRARLRANLTQKQLEKLSGFSQGQISAYENGNVKELTREKLEILARAMGAPIEELGIEIPQPEIGLAEVLRREYPNMDAGTINTLREMAAFLYQQHQQATARKQRSARKGARVVLGTSDNTATPGEASSSS